MFKIESSVVIDAPVEEVFDWVQHPQRHHSWQHSLIETEHADGKVVVVRKFLGRRMETHYHKREVVPNKSIHRRGESGPGMPFKYTAQQDATFETVGGGTKVTFVTEIDSQGAFKAAEPAIKRMSKHEQDASLNHLKELIEAHDDLHEVVAQFPEHK